MSGDGQSWRSGGDAEDVTSGQCCPGPVPALTCACGSCLRGCEAPSPDASRPPHHAQSSNQAERDVRPAKVQMRTSGGCWRTLDGLADFAIVQSYLSTAGFSRGAKRA